MKDNSCIKFLVFTAVSILLCLHVYAQQPLPSDSASASQIFIINAQRLNYEKKDSTEYQSAAGKVAIRQGTTLFYCDSVVLNRTANKMEAFGHVHINDADSIHTYCDYLRYTGSDKKAYLKGNVKLTDGKGTLTTTDLDYDVNTKIGIYTKSGKVVSNKSVLTSKEGYYYGETKDVYFKKDVLLVDPENTVKTDTLLFNTETNVATFVAPTEIKGKNNQKILTSSGYYDAKNKKAFFAGRPHIEDSTVILDADEVATDDSSGFSEARGRVIYKDTAQGVIIIANNLKSNKKEESFLATQKPVMILKQDNDSIYIAADTFFSAKLSNLRRYRDVPVIVDGGDKDDENDKDDKNDASYNDSINDKADIAKDTITLNKAIVKNKTDDLTDSNDSSDSSNDLTDPSNNLSKKKDSTDRFIEAYAHVKIYNDSLQAVCDSLFYSAEDSAFRLFKSPIVWSKQDQITGDTIYLFTEKKKPKRLYVFENALSNEKAGDNYYNQVKGRTINGYFDSGRINFIRTKGNAESVYFAQDDDGRFIGVDKNSCDVIDMYFVNGEADRIVFRSSLQGTTYPMRQANLEDMKLRGFQWHDNLRPKTKYDLFGD